MEESKLPLQGLKVIDCATHMAAPWAATYLADSVAKRQGNRLSSAAPRNVYQTKEGEWVALSASAQPIAENVFKAIGRPDLITDQRFQDNSSRVKNVDELDEIVGNWISDHTLQEVVDTFMNAGAVIGPVYTMDKLFTDPHFQHRESFVEVEDDDFGKVKMPNVAVKMSRTPGKVRHSGAAKGQHNEEVFRELGLTPEQVRRLKEEGII